MSLERAYVNCQRCYELSKFTASQTVYATERVLRDNVRDEAMMALEADINQHIALKESGKETGRNALKACAKCDFTTANIADIVKDIVKGKI